MLTRFNGVSLSKKVKPARATPYITFSGGSVIRTETFDTDTSYNVYLITSTTTATIFNPSNITIYYVAIGKGGGSNYGGYGTSSASGGGGGGGYYEESFVVTGNTSIKSMSLTVGSSVNTNITLSGIINQTAGNGGDGTNNGSGRPGALGSSGGGGGSFKGSSIIYSGGTGSAPGNRGGSGGGNSSGNNYGGGGGGAGGSGSAGGSSSGAGGPGKTPTSPGIKVVYNSSYCVGGNGAFVNRQGTGGGGGGGWSTYGSGAGGQYNAPGGSGQSGAIMLAISVNDIPSPIV